MATILKSNDRNFQENPNRIEPFKLFTDISRIQKGVKPENLNFDLRQLNPGQYCSAYHFHRYAEELFLIISGSATLRTPKGLEAVSSGDLIFFEKGETGAHQLYNHTTEPCVYLDIRTFIGYDIANIRIPIKYILFRQVRYSINPPNPLILTEKKIPRRNGGNFNEARQYHPRRIMGQTKPISYRHRLRRLGTR